MESGKNLGGKGILNSECRRENEGELLEGPRGIIVDPAGCGTSCLMEANLLAQIPRVPCASAELDKGKGPFPLPIIGNLHQLGALPHRSLQRLAEKHGPMMMLKFGSVPVVIASSS
ncbi:hypothetical protein SUGI_1021170 [Cryptomeria japonica]|nr:hypothetical protein SUGI_1021170 [Cryptomeria japonica]